MNLYFIVQCELQRLIRTQKDRACRRRLYILEDGSKEVIQSWNRAHDLPLFAQDIFGPVTNDALRLPDEVTVHFVDTAEAGESALAGTHSKRFVSRCFKN